MATDSSAQHRARSESNASTDAGRVVVLAGGVGAARFLRGVVRAVPEESMDRLVP